MELRFTTATEREMDAVEAAILNFLTDVVGVESEEVLDSRVEKTSEGYVLIISFVPSEKLNLKFEASGNFVAKWFQNWIQFRN